MQVIRAQMRNREAMMMRVMRAQGVVVVDDDWKPFSVVDYVGYTIYVLSLSPFVESA